MEVQCPFNKYIHKCPFKWRNLYKYIPLLNCTGLTSWILINYCKTRKYKSLTMAKNGNLSAIMKELLSNWLKYANPIINTVLDFKATFSRLCMWLWTLSNDSAYSSLFVNQTLYSRAHVTSVCFWQPMWEVVCLWAVLRCNLWTCSPTNTGLSLTYFTIGIYQFRLSVDQDEDREVDKTEHSDVSFDSMPSEELWMMNWSWAASLHDFSAWG